MSTNGSLNNFWGSGNQGTTVYGQQTGYDDYYVDPQVTVGGWILTFFILSIPVVNVIMLIYWAVKDTKPARQTFSRAMLFWILVMITVMLVLMVLLYDKLNYAVIFDKYSKSFRTLLKVLLKK